MSLAKRIVSAVTAATTILWSLGLSMLVPNAAYAAITVSGPNELIPPGGMHVPANSFDIPLFRFALTQSASETLSSVTLTITNNTGGAVTNDALSSHLRQLSVFKDSNSNGVFDPGTDLLAGSVSTVKVATSTNAITASANNSLAAAGGLATSFFVMARTGAGWTGADSFKVTMATDGIATSANSPTITAFSSSNAVDAALGGGGGGFNVQKVQFVNATTVDVAFTDTLDINSGNATSTANYTLTTADSGDNSAITSVLLLPDNKSVRVVASAGVIVSTGTDTLAVNANVKNAFGITNGNTAANPIFDGFQPLVISEVKAGSASDQYDEFLEIYNRSGASVGTSSLKVHLVNADGSVDVNVPLTFMNGVSIPSNGYFLIAPVSSPASTTADAVYATSSIRSIIPNGAVYLSNSTASSSAVIDRVCWGTHTPASDCEGTAATALPNDGTSLERKANNASTAATMATGGSDATNGNSNDTGNNNFDFVARSSPGSQNSSAATEAPGGGSAGGAGNSAPAIQHASVFNAAGASAFTFVARMTDDGGTLSANKTQMIFCTTAAATCTPASSTPIYGTSIGSGWFKFSSTSSAWSTNKTLLKYYLQAMDNASPAKTKVFTNDPTFDSVTFDTSTNGIQTSALQESKSLSVTISSSNLGSASVSGSVVDTSSVAVSGATVWIEGTQFAATTGNDGTFSFSNVGPSGGKQIRVAKDGYADQISAVFIPPSGLVSLPAITLYSGTMGVGGDFTMPKVVSSNPINNSNGFPTQAPDATAPSLTLNFSKSMDTTTIINADATAADSKIYLTEAGSGAKIAGSVTAPSATQAVFRPSSTLTAGKGYTLYVTPGVKDSAGNPVTGNGPGGQFVLMFSTAGQVFSAPGSVTNFGMGNSFPPFVKGSMPAPGSTGIARNAKVFVTFSEAMQDTSANRANVTLYSVTNPFTASESKTAVSATNSFDTTGKILIITPASTLSASTHYRVEVLGGITSSKGVPLGNPGTAGYATTVMYKGDFDTSAASDSTAPTIIATIPAASATGVSTVNPIVVNFSEAMDPSTITDSSVKVQLGSTAVDGTLSYDATSWVGKFVPTYGLSSTSTFTTTVTTDAKDLAGNALDQDSSTSGAQALQRTFTTGSADTTSPTVVSAQGNDFSMQVKFSKPMLAVPNGDLNFANSVLKSENYSIRIVNSSGVVQSTLTLPPTATVTYDAAARSVSLTGLPSISGFAAGTTLMNVVVSNVKDIGFNSLAAGGTSATSTAQSSATGGGFAGGGLFQDASGNNIQGGQFGPPPNELAAFSSSGIGFIPSVKVLPLSTLAGLSTTYFIGAPLSKQIPASGYLDITFPDGTDVTNAKQDTNSKKNTDMNGPGAGTVVFATSEGTLPSGWTTGGASSDGVIVNTSSRTVRVILGSVATRSESSDTHDFLEFDIAQIVNPTIVTSVGTAGNTASVETKKADGTVLETLTSGSFFTTQGGSTTVRGRVLSGATGLNGVNVFLMSPQTGPQSTTTANNRFGAADGEFMFQSLGDGQYMLGVEQFFKNGGTSYTAGFPVPVMVNSTNCASSVCSQNVSVTNASTGATVTLDISGTFSDSGDAVDIFASGPGAFRMSTTTLTGTLTNNTSNSIKLNANGTWMVGFGPSMSTEIFGKGSAVVRPSWVIPKPQQVTVSGCPTACSVTPTKVAFSPSAANKTIKFTVKDASSNKLGQSHVFAYSPAGGTGNSTDASADGTGSLGLSYGTYKISASIPGMPPGIERSVSIRSVSGADTVFIDGSTTGIALSSMAVTDLILIVSKPPHTISGKVTDGTNPVSGAPVSASRTDGPGFAQTFTNSSGEYTLYVTNGIWAVDAFLPSQFGRLPRKTITISGSSASSQNFEPNTSSVNYATITKDIGSDTDADSVFDGGEGLSNVQVTVQGTTSGGDPYINVVTTDSNGSSTLKVPPGTYTMKAWSPTIGELPAFDTSLVVNSAGTATTNPSNLLAPKTATVTVNVFDEYGVATTTDKMAIEFMQIGGKTDSAAMVTAVSSTAFTLPVYDAGAANIATGAVTSTNPSNFYLMKIVTPGISESAISAYGGGSTIMATSSIASGWYKVEVDGSETINVQLPAISYVSGSVADANATAVPDAVVHIENKSTGETMEVKADTSGNYMAKLSAGTYLVQAQKDGYIDTASSVTVSTSGTIPTAATTVAVADSTITGTIQTDGTAISGATVRAEKLGGGVVSATTGTDGTYTLKVTSGDWKVSASADGYTEKAYSTVVSAGSSGININLTVAKSNLAAATSLSLTPQSGGTLSDSTANASINAPQSALSTSANTFSMNEKETSNVVGGGSGSPIGGEAKTLTSYDNDGSEVTTLNSTVAVGASYSTTDLASSLGTLTIAKIEKVKMGSLDTTADNWEHLPTTVAYKNSSGNFVEPSSDLSNVATVAFTGQTSHFSVFNPIASSDGLSPSAPTGVSGSFGNGSITVTWTAPTTNSDGTSLSDLLGYEVYRSTSANGTYTQLNSSDVSSVSYTDTSAIQGTTYFYKVTTADTGGLESAMSSASSGVLASGVTGGQNAATGSGGGGGGAQPAQPATTTTSTPATPTVPATPEVAPLSVIPGSSASKTVSPTARTLSSGSGKPSQAAPAAFTRQLALGSKGEDVKRLQETLQDMGYFPATIASNGVYGPSTAAAVGKFQKANGLASVGRVGPATLKALNMGEGVVSVPVSIPIGPATFSRQLGLGMRGDDVKRLQEALQSMGYFSSSIAPNGVYGPTTADAVGKFQRANGLASVGRVGPATLKALNSGEAVPSAVIEEPVAAAEPSINAPPSFTRQMRTGMRGEDVKRLQETLQAMDYFPGTVTPNGVYGPATAAAVRKFQKAKGLAQVGNVGPATLTALNE